jgi:hypothetical protein
MFYSGADYEPVAVPPGLPGHDEGTTLEGLRVRPALAMSQVKYGSTSEGSTSISNACKSCSGVFQPCRVYVCVVSSVLGCVMDMAHYKISYKALKQ